MAGIFTWGLHHLRTRPLAFLLVWMSRFEQLAWAPIMLALFLTVTGGDDARAESFTAVAASAFSLANLAGNLLAGPALDRWGRYFLSGIGLLLMAVTAGMHVAVAAPVALVSVRVLHGLSAAIISPASLAVVGDSAPRARRAEAMAMAGIVIAIATTVGPVISGRLASSVSTVTAVGMIAAMLAISGLIVVAFGRRADAETADLARAEQAATGSEARAFNPGQAAIAATGAFVLFFAQNVFFYRMPIDARAMGLTAAHTGVLFGVFAMATVIAFAPPLSRLGDRHGRRIALLLGLSLSAGSLAFVTFAKTPIMLAAGLAAYGLGFGFTFPAIAALSTDAALFRRRGLSFGLFTAASSAGAVVGPLVTNALRNLLSPYMVASLMVVIGLIAVAVWQEHREASNAAVS